jgi:hypothetical protein
VLRFKPDGGKREVGTKGNANQEIKCKTYDRTSIPSKLIKDACFYSATVRAGKDGKSNDARKIFREVICKNERLFDFDVRSYVLHFISWLAFPLVPTFLFPPSGLNLSTWNFLVQICQM